MWELRHEHRWREYACLFMYARHFHICISLSADGMRVIGRIPTSTSQEMRIYPLPHTYVVKDLVPDLTQFYKQYKSIKPYLQRETKTEDVRHLQIVSTHSFTRLLDSFAIHSANKKSGQRKPDDASRSQEARRALRMHSLRLLLYVLPLLLVELGRIPRPGRASTELSLAGRLA